MDNTELIFRPSIREDAQAQRRVREWIAALRSGKYEQCGGRLHLEGDGFCCLGVLLDQIDSAAWKLVSNYTHDMAWEYWDDVKGQKTSAAMSLAGNVWKRLHLRDDIGSFNAPDRPEESVEYNDSLTRLNDDGIPFAKIADKIEHDLDAVLAG